MNLRLLISVVAFLACGLAATPAALGQRLPKNTGREPENKPAGRREGVHKRQTAPAGSKSPASAESANFFDLGERFRQQKKWNAAEAAYKEAVKVWSGNIDALQELGFLYIDTNRMDDAQQTYSQLRSLNESYASNLLAEIKKRKAALAH